MDFQTVAGEIVAFVLALIITSWIKNASGWLGDKMSVSIKHQWIRLKHYILHFLPTKTHNEPIYNCLDRGCDTIYVNLQALEPPTKEKTPETFDY